MRPRNRKAEAYGLLSAGTPASCPLWLCLYLKSCRHPNDHLKDFIVPAAFTLLCTASLSCCTCLPLLHSWSSFNFCTLFAVGSILKNRAWLCAKRLLFRQNSNIYLEAGNGWQVEMLGHSTQWTYKYRKSLIEHVYWMADSLIYWLNILKGSCRFVSCKRTRQNNNWTCHFASLSLERLKTFQNKNRKTKTESSGQLMVSQPMSCLMSRNWQRRG